MAMLVGDSKLPQMATMGHAWKVLVWSADKGVNDNMEDDMLLLWLLLGVLL